MKILSQSKYIVWGIIFLTLMLTYMNGIPKVIAWDAFGQYIYLPMIFDKGQVVFSNLEYFEDINQKNQLSSTLYQFINLENGNVITKYTLGFSLLLMPFYLIAELWSVLGGYPTDGFSTPYQVMTAVGSNFYCILGLYYLRKFLLFFFNDQLTLKLLIIITLGTNYLFMHIDSLGSTHNLVFAILSVLLYYTHKFHENPTYKNGLMISISLGLITLVRIPDVIFACIPLFWLNNSYSTIKDKIFKLILPNWKVISLMLLVFFSIVFLQLIYWKLNAGSWIINSYSNNPGEGFDWKTPYIFEILFSFRKGWFIYTPILLLSIFGFYFLIKRNKNGLLFLLIFLLFFYIVSSWTTWWYAASYSCRALLDIYPILLFSMGFLYLSLKSKKTKFVFNSILLILIFLNLFQTYQAKKGILSLERMTKAYYISTFGQFSSPSAEQNELLLPDREELIRSHTIDNSKFRKTKEINIPFEKPVLLNDSSIFTPKISYQWTKLSTSPYFWIKTTWHYEGEIAQLEGKFFTACAMYKELPYAWIGMKSHDQSVVIHEEKNTISHIYFSPHFRTKKDELQVGIWKESGDSIRIKSCKIEIFESRKKF
jgi:hypothetical protein